VSASDRKPRRLSLAQARACEMGVHLRPGRRYKSRCRCGGRLEGARRVPAKATRWDFAMLGEGDPHYIPRPRRRISPRNAAHMLYQAQTHVHRQAAHQVLADAQVQAGVVVATERVHSEVRTRRTRILNGYFYPWRRRSPADFRLKRGEYHQADPLGWALTFLQRAGRHYQAWLQGRTLGPPGMRAGPPVDRRSQGAVFFEFLQAQMGLVVKEQPL
jgi:hypothetical protein